MYKVYDRKLRQVTYCDSIKELWVVAYSKSIAYRAVVYFDENATEEELIEDLEGVNCRVEKGEWA